MMGINEIEYFEFIMIFGCNLIIWFFIIPIFDKYLINLINKIKKIIIKIITPIFYLLTLLLICLFFYYLSNKTYPSLTVEIIWLILNSVLLIYGLIYIYDRMLLLYIKNSKKSEDSKGTNLSPDVPIEDEEEDKLNLKEFVDSIVKSINNYNQKNSITFGLFGDWGSGKTSLTNCIKHKLKNNERYIVIDFIPWQYNNRDNMLKEFYYKISKELDSIYAYLKIKKYALYNSLEKLDHFLG